MKRIADIAVYSPDDRLKLIVEVKSYRNATDEWGCQTAEEPVSRWVHPSLGFFPAGFTRILLPLA